MKNFNSKYAGILIGSLYGLAMRQFFELKETAVDFGDLFSITFVWIVPIIIGTTSLLFATKEQLASSNYTIGRPVLSVFLFFLFAFLSGKEDIICLVIISLPFLVAAGFGGLFVSTIIRKYRNKNGITYSLLLLPLLTGTIEQNFPTPSKVYEVKTSVIVNSVPELIWGNVVRVRELGEDEYQKGFFNYAGIPRPVRAQLDRDTLGATRIGFFEGGLTFKESVTAWERNKTVAFDIEVVPSSIRQTVFEKHVLKGNHFTFLNARYELYRLSKTQTRLTLVSSYQLDTKINAYGSFWGKQLLGDFQIRLLNVIRKRCEEPTVQ